MVSSLTVQHELLQLTSEDFKFSQDRCERVVVDPTLGLMLVPQSSEGFIIQIKTCMKRQE